MKKLLFLPLLCIIFSWGCSQTDPMDSSEIKGYQLLSDLSGHWIGSNKTAFGDFDWFAFDFRPISSSHLHSIYEGATN